MTEGDSHLPHISNRYNLYIRNSFYSFSVSRRQRSCLGGERHDEHQEQMWMMRGVICCWWLFRSHQIVYFNSLRVLLGKQT